MAELLKARGLTMDYPLTGSLKQRMGSFLRAVDNVNLEIDEGETLGLVGESGCGKSTIARLLIRLLEPTGGEILFRGQDISHKNAKELVEIRRQMQIVFQDPYSSLNPKKSVGFIVGEPIRIHRNLVGDGTKQVGDLLEMVGLSRNDASRYPHEFSGGQRQRIAIARGIALRPRLLILDEPVSALDVSVQAQIINLLDELQEELNLSYLLISHDLSVVRHLSDRIAVMYLGKIVEKGFKREVMKTPTHPYTHALLSAVPSIEGSSRNGQSRILLAGEAEEGFSRSVGCNFRARCWKSEGICQSSEPELVDRFGLGHASACHFASFESGIDAD